MSGPDFGEWEYQLLICVRSIYGMKKYMNMRYEGLSYMLKLIGYHSSEVDPDPRMRDAVYHYVYIIIYSHDLLVLSKDPIGIFRVLNDLLLLKVVGEPELYLGGDVGNV